MQLVPTIPRDPIARIRLLSIWFVLFANLVELGEVAFGSVAAMPSRVLGALALIALTVWLGWGYRRGKFPEFSTPVDAVLLIAIGASTQMPLRAMGVFLAVVQFRALYVSRREFWLLPISVSAARVAAIALSPRPTPYDAISWTVLLQGIGLVIISGILFLLVLAADRQAEAERALQRSEERYRVLAAATHDMVYDWNVATDTVEHTDAIRSVFGFDDADVVRDRYWWLSRIHPADRAMYDAAIASLLAGASGVASGIRYRVRRGDGSVVTVAERAVLQRDAAGSNVRVIGSVRDITVEDQLEEQLRQAQKMEAVGQLAGGAAHDFNNLLTVIGGHVFMLEQQAAIAPEAARHLEGITRAAERAGALTRQLLAFGRKQVLRPTVLNLNAVVIDVVRMIAPIVGERVTLITALDPALAPTLADAGQIEQVLINLSINARDAMPDGGTLRIATTNGFGADLGKVKLTVTDTGTGMDAETLSHLFEPFFTTKAAGKGTGLGLATAYGIIKQSFGDITVESTLDGGSTFTIALPVAKTTGAVTTVPVQAPAKFTQPAGAKRVLLVEDDNDVRDFAREVLNRAGFEVLPARNGLDGLSVARANDYAIDLVVTDVVMPEMGGRQMVEQLRRVRPDLRVLYISGYANDAEARRELGSGEALLLEKPFTARTLREAVDSVGTG